MATVSTDSLIAYWALEEVSGQRNDSHGSNHLSDNGSVGQAAGKIGNAADFVASSSQYLSIADNAALSTGDIDFTVTGWIYPTSVAAGIAYVINRWGAASNEREYRVYREANQLKFTVRGSDGIEHEAIGNVTLSVNNWYFFVAWHDSVANTVNLQMNNGTVVSTAHTAGAVDLAIATALGGRSTTPLQFFGGRIDEASFWKRVLTSQERTDLYNGGNGLAYPFGAGGGGSPSNVGPWIGIGL